MTHIVVHSRVGPDGVLHVDLPLGGSGANREVRLIVEEVVGRSATSDRQAWHDFIRRTAGAWQGELEPPAQGDPERRDELP